LSNGNHKTSANANNIFEQVELESQKQSRYLKLADGEVKTLQFNPKKIALVDNEFNGKVTKRVEYQVVDPEKTTDGEKTMSMAITNARRINRLLQRGRHVLEIERIGSGMETIYNISAAQ
jgi:hypothetical protein